MSILNMTILAFLFLNLGMLKFTYDFQTWYDDMVHFLLMLSFLLNLKVIHIYLYVFFFFFKDNSMIFGSGLSDPLVVKRFTSNLK